MAGFKPRAIDFPDHNADDFDPDVIVTHNDIDYTWNGYGWEVVCKGGGSVEEYDDQWIKDDQIRQDEEFKKDQERQDQEIEDLKQSLEPCTGRSEELTCVGLHVTADADTWPLEGQWSYNDSPYINQIFVETNWIEVIGTHPDVIDKIWINEVEYEVEGANKNTSNALGRDCLSINTVARIPDEITSGNEKIHLSLCPPGYDFVTHEEFEKDQERQDDEIERIETESKARDVLLELQLLALKGSDCKHSHARIVENTPPYVYNYDIAVVDDHTLRVVVALTESLELHVGTIMSMDADDVQVDHEWTEPITAIGEEKSHGTGWITQDLSFDNPLPDFVINAQIYDRVHLYGCNPIDSVYVNKEGDTMSGDLKVNADVIADNVVTRVIDSGENSNLELKHDGNTKVYVGSGQLTSQEKLKLNKEGTEDFHAVTKGYIDTDQKRQDDELQAEITARAERDLQHDAQINTIEYKLDALVGLQFKGIYEFKHEADCNTVYEQCVQNCMAIDPQDQECLRLCGQNQVDCEKDKVRPGYFEAVDPDDQFDHLEYIVISKSDKAGVEIDWAGVLDAGDYLEVDHTADGVLDKTNYGLYRITEEPELSINAFGEEVYTLKLQFLQGDGAFNVRENYEIRGITAAEGVNPEELADFLTKEEAADLYSLKTHVHAWGEITGKPSTYPPSSHTHSDYLSKSTTNEQTIKSALSGKYYYGQTSSRDNGMMCRKDIEALVSSSGGSNGSDHNHDSRYPMMSKGATSSPSPSQGNFYLNTSQKVLYIGV